MNRFTDLHMCDFTASEHAQHLHSLAEQYVRETEAYDRSVCTGPTVRGEILPASRREFALVNSHARELLDSLCQRHPQHRRREIRRAIQTIDRRLVHA
ncbi:hypothetical protein [Pseudomonas spirodelae]|uniref:Uncharacterized protein n=1 Tax=Pseudomonas spirodelae TaxID=3101751 RepID=A0ABU5P908_9PSED|nr:hypothetical protein [Pseudomonas sp. T5W1]MEA1606162.1 hypothetical protein [Pseudomonas sp. T5W1]